MRRDSNGSDKSNKPGVPRQQPVSGRGPRQKKAVTPAEGGDVGERSIEHFFSNAERWLLRAVVVLQLAAHLATVALGEVNGLLHGLNVSTTQAAEQKSASMNPDHPGQHPVSIVQAETTTPSSR